jgi:hypothetical protein
MSSRKSLIRERLNTERKHYDNPSPGVVYLKLDLCRVMSPR